MPAKGPSTPASAELTPPREPLPAAELDEGFYRICGVKGSGKTQLVKLFTLEALSELETNPWAKLVVYEPKREFYAWLSSLGLSRPVTYFMPSDTRSVALDFTTDYPSYQDSKTLTYAFYPENPREHERFWGDSLRTIYAAVLDAIKEKMGYVDLRLVCLVLEDEELTAKLLESDRYFIEARNLLLQHKEARNETAQSIRMTIYSRIAEMKVLAAHMEAARSDNGLFSLREFITKPDQGPLVVSKDSTYHLVHDPINGVLFLRLMQLLDSEQYDKRRKIFIIIDEFPTLAGDVPCPGIHDMFLRLRSRGVVLLITYQAHTTLKRVYGEHVSEIVGQCNNVIHLSQADVESAEYAAKDLGMFQKTQSSQTIGANTSFTSSQQKYEEYYFPPTSLMDIPPANPADGVQGRARVKSPRAGKLRWAFTYPPNEIAAIPRPDPAIREYVKRDPELGKNFQTYTEFVKRTQRIEPLTSWERDALLREGRKQRHPAERFIYDDE